LNGPESAPTLVLSNAIGTDLNFWDGQLAAFTEDFRVLRYDARGHGGSSSPAGEYALADLGNDVIELMDWLEIESAHVCGVSLGGLTALWLAIATPQRCRSLIAANTAARVGTRDGWIERIEQVREQGVVSIADTSLARCFTAAFLQDHPEQRSVLWRMLERCSLTGYSGCCAALRDADLSQDVARISMPTLILAGTHDVATPPADGHFLQRSISNSRYEELNASHLSNIEAAEDFNRAVLHFLERSPA
jgi:3-oxoadipate enol-lactonase